MPPRVVGLTGLLALLFVPAPCTPAESVHLEFESLAPQIIQQRLESVPHSLAKREAALIALFHQAGCEIAEQRVPHSKAPNLICTLPGTGPGEIVVGGHFDFVDEGDGAIDDWSGAVMLPSLYQSLKGRPRHHRFVFVAFAAEETGMWGSQEFVKQLSGEEKSALHAMINLECLGTSPPKVWGSRADKQLMNAYVRAALALQLQPQSVNVEKVGDDDSHAFLNAGIPVLTIHSVTQVTFQYLHTARDNLRAIHPADYYDAYRLAATLLALLDSTEQ